MKRPDQETHGKDDRDHQGGNQTAAGRLLLLNGGACGKPPLEGASNLGVKPSQRRPRGQNGGADAARRNKSLIYRCGLVAVKSLPGK